MTGDKEDEVGSPQTGLEPESVLPRSEPKPMDVTPEPFPSDRDRTGDHGKSSARLSGSAESAPLEASTAIRAEREADRPKRSRSGIIPALLGIAVLFLLGAVAYLFSAMPDVNRMSALDSNLGDLKKEVAGIAARPQADTSGLTGRLDAVEADLKSMKSALASLQSRLDGLPATPSALPDDLKGQLGDLASKVTAASQANSQVQQQTAGLADKLGAVDGETTALKAGLDSFDKRLAPIESELAAAKSSDRVTEARQNGNAAETRAAPIAVTAQAVLRAVDAGQPFAPDLAVLKTLGADPAALERLKDVADTGAPTTKDLRAALADLREKMTVGNAPAPSGSYINRLMSGAATLVRVRPLGSVVGDSPGAIVARMDDDLAHDDLAATLDEWQKLPEATRTSSKSLAERIRLRQSAQIAARAIGGDAIKAMATAQQ